MFFYAQSTRTVIYQRNKERIIAEGERERGEREREGGRERERDGGRGERETETEGGRERQRVTQREREGETQRDRERESCRFRKCISEIISFDGGRERTISRLSYCNYRAPRDSLQCRL